MFIHVTLDTVPLLLSGPHKLAGGLGFLDLNERNGPQIGEPQRPDPDRLNSTFIAVRRRATGNGPNGESRGPATGLRIKRARGL